jgi:hypothetical protein
MKSSERLYDPEVWEQKFVFPTATHARYARLRHDALFTAPIIMTLQDRILDHLTPKAKATPYMNLLRGDLE